MIVMKDSVNVETGYRGDLECMKVSHFNEMAISQGVTFPECGINQEIAEKDRRVQATLDRQKKADSRSLRHRCNPSASETGCSTSLPTSPTCLTLETSPRLV